MEKKIKLIFSEVDFEIDLEIKKVFEIAGILFTKSTISVNKVEVYSVEYEKHLFVAIDSGVYTLRNMPIFGNIKTIFINRDYIYLYCKEYVTE